MLTHKYLVSHNGSGRAVTKVVFCVICVPLATFLPPLTVALKQNADSDIYILLEV